MVGAGGNISYIYDALNRRIAKVLGQDTTYFFYSGFRVVEERKSIVGNPSVQYFYGNNLDEMFAMSKNTSFSYLHSNLIGSVVYASNTSGIMVEQYRYDPYGKVKILAPDGMLRDSSAISNPYLFTGQRLDAETGLYHYKFRQYNPYIGRFMQRDPLGFIDGFSLYEYAMSNPILHSDELGLSSNCNKDKDKDKKNSCNTPQLSRSDQRVLDSKIKTCGCPSSSYEVKDYSVYDPNTSIANQANCRGIIECFIQSIWGFPENINSVIIKREGLAFQWNSGYCANKSMRFWSETSAKGVVVEASERKVNEWGTHYNEYYLHRGFKWETGDLGETNSNGSYK
jgi:RHS repeat-associated protein